MNPLSKNAQVLLDWLVERLPKARSGDSDSYTSYGEGLIVLNLTTPKGKTAGEHLRDNGLEELASWLYANKLPAITGLIVDQSKDPKKPGVGYYSVNERETDDEDWWHEEIAKSKQFDWSRFVSKELRQKLQKPALPPPVDTPRSLDLAEPPPRVEMTIYRILRDTALAQQVKALHDYTCQLCGEPGIELPDGSRYAECHHVKPLGAPHGGNDVLENVLCVCPNCHVKLDYGVIEIEMSALRTKGEHKLAVDYVRYHNQKIYRRKQ